MITELSQLLHDSLSAGSGSARASFGGKSEAFSYLPPLVNATVGHVQKSVTKSRNFSAMLVDSNGATLAPVADGAEKPVTAVLLHENVSCKTYPGVVTVKTGDLLDASGLGAAITQALYGQAIRALDADLVTDLMTGLNGISGAASLQTIAQAQATLLGDGFSPDICVVSPQLYASLASAATGLMQGGNNPQFQQIAVLGSTLTVSPALSGDEAIVMDANSVQAVEHESSPVALVDVHARTNSADVVIEIVAGWVITQPEGFVPIKAATK